MANVIYFLHLRFDIGSLDPLVVNLISSVIRISFE